MRRRELAVILNQSVNRPGTIIWILLAGVGSIYAAGGAKASFHFGEPEEKLLAESDALDRQFEKDGLIYRDTQADALLNRVGQRLNAVSPVPDRVAYRFHILRDPMINAFALANGSIYVNTGLIAVMHNESQFAAVLAHEITHVVNRHEFELNRSIRKKSLALNIVALVGPAVPVGGAFGASLSAAATLSQVVVVATVYGYSRELEQEADDQGFARLTKAQYDGSAMPQALQLLDEKIEYEPVEPFWRTHPKLVARIASAQKLASGEHTESPATVSDNDYLAQMRGVIRYSIEEDLQNRRARTAVARAQRLVDWQPNDALNESLLADAYRGLGAKTPQPEPAESTRAGIKDDRTMMLKRTAAEEQEVLLAKPEGPAALAANRSRAEADYIKAIGEDPQLADAHRGLGSLYEDEGKREQAAAEYRQYLKLAAPNAVDRLRIERRIGALEGAPGAPAK